MKEFCDALSTELNTQPDDSNTEEQMLLNLPLGPSNASLMNFLMESLAVNKLPELVTGQRSVPEEEVLYESELQKLSPQIQERFHILAQLMEKIHQAAAEEDDQVKALEVFFTRKDATQGPL